MLPADAARPAAIVIEVPSTTRGAARPIAARDGSIAGWATVRDGNSVLITMSSDPRDAGYQTIRAGRVTQIIRGSQPDVVLQRVGPNAAVIEGHHDAATPAVHVPQPQVIETAH